MDALILALALFDLTGLVANVALGMCVWQERQSRKALRKLDRWAAERRSWRVTSSRRLRFG